MRMRYTSTIVYDRTHTKGSCTLLMHACSEKAGKVSKGHQFCCGMDHMTLVCWPEDGDYTWLATQPGTKSPSDEQEAWSHSRKCLLQRACGLLLCWLCAADLDYQSDPCCCSKPSTWQRKGSQVEVQQPSLSSPLEKISGVIAPGASCMSAGLKLEAGTAPAAAHQ